MILHAFSNDLRIHFVSPKNVNIRSDCLGYWGGGPTMAVDRHILEIHFWWRLEQQPCLSAVLMAGVFT